MVTDYAFDNPVAFNNVFSVKFIESNRNFDNMKLYFRLPGRSQIINARTGVVLSTGEAATVFDSVKTAINATNPFGGTGVAYVDLRVTQFGPSKLVETTVTRVEGDCVIGAKSFTIQEGSEDPEPPKAIGDRLDKNTLQNDLILYMLGNEVEVRTVTLGSCGQFSPSSSGGSEGTLDIWDISAIPTGATFDFEFKAYNEPDKFRVEYPSGTVLLDTGWRGSTTPIDGVLEGPGRFDKLNLFAKGNSNTLKVLVTGGRSGTAWNYKVRCNDQGTGGTGGTVSPATWRVSDFGNFDFNGNTTGAVGTYPSDNGRIEGSFTGTVLDGYWIGNGAAYRCNTQRDGSDYWGRVLLTLNPADDTISGWWDYCGSGTQHQVTGSVVSI